MEKTVNKKSNWLIKLVAILAACVLLLVGLSLLRTSQNATAAEYAEQTLTLSSVSVHRGQEFDVDLAIQNNGQGIQAVRLEITYDTSVMTLVGVEAKDPANGSAWSANFNAAGEDPAGGYASYGTAERPFVLLWIGSSKLYGEGTIATLSFVSNMLADVGKYDINVHVDTNSTLLARGQKRDLHVYGDTDTVELLPPVYSVELLNYDGSRYAYEQSNELSVTIAQAMESKNNVPPVRQGDDQYTYTFRGWRLRASSEENHPVYEPTFTAIAVPHDITFKKGIKEEGESVVRYTGENTYETIQSIPYASIIDFDSQLPAKIDEYTFYGWYSDEDCTVPVSFVTMLDHDTTVYGYYRYNADDPAVTTTTLSVDTVVEDGYVVATVSVSKNTGFNSMRFAPAFDQSKLTFVGFLYESDSPFYGAFRLTAPEINDTVKAGGDIQDEWQNLAGGETIDGKSFLFVNANRNVFITGKLLKLKFAVKADAETGSASIGVDFGEKNVTRFVADGSIWYANAEVQTASAAVMRVVKPTAYLPEDDKTYTYAGGQTVAYEFKTEGGKNYYTLAGNERTTAGSFTVTATLKSVANTLVTWADGTTDPLEFTFEVLPFAVTKPVAAGGDYVYDGNDKIFAFTAESLVHKNLYYTISGDTKKLVGVYEVKAVLADKANTVWAGGTTADLTFDFVIQRKKVVKPTAYLPEDGKTYTYADGATLTYEFKTEGGKTDFTVTNNERTTAGTSTVNVALNDKNNTEWADDDQTVDVDDLSFTFTVGKKSVTKPTAYLPEDNKTYTYLNGDNVTYEFKTEGDKTYYSVDGNVQTDADSYVVTVSLTDADNTMWEGGSTDDLEFAFVIGKRFLPTPILQAKAYTGFAQKADVSFLTGEEPYEVTQNDEHTEKGVYDVIFTFKEGAFDNYGWEDSLTEDVVAEFRIETVVNKWTVTPFVVSKTYDGTPAWVSAAAAEQGEVVVTYRLQTSNEAYTSVAPVNAGAYYVKFFVAGTESYGSLTEILSFDIYKVRLTAPTQTVKTYVYTGSEQTYEFDNAGDTEKYTVTNGTRLNAGQQNVIVSITDKDNYVWKGATPEEDNILDIVFPFEIAQVQIACPTPVEKTYVYTGREQSFEFSSAVDTDRYTITGRTRVGAGSQTVTVALIDKVDYCWAGGSSEDVTFTFDIAKAKLTIPVASDRKYVYNGSEHTFEFSAAGDTEQYDVTGNKRTDVGVQTVTASIRSKDNYEWADNTSADKTYTFSVSYASVTGATEGENAFVVTLSSQNGFDANSTFTVVKASPDAETLLAAIAAADKRAALGQLTDEDAQALVRNKCLVASLVLNLTPIVGVGTYDYEVTLPAPRAGVVVIRFAGDDVEVFDTTAVGENKITFTSDKVGNFVILADHSFGLEIADEAYLKSAATCEQAAVYYKSCACGACGEDTFVYGEPLGHDYDFENILWVWSDDHLSATAVVACKRDALHTAVFPTEVSVIERVAPGADTSGYVVREASFSHQNAIYRGTDREVLPANGHVFTSLPAWVWKTANGVYSAKALFTCDCGESTVTLDAAISAEVSASKILYTAETVFQGAQYRDQREIDRPVVIFDFNDRVTDQVSMFALPGASVEFVEAPARLNYVFVGWRDENGTLIVKDQNGEYLDYKIGFDRVVFTAEWKSFATLDVRVTDTTGAAIEGANVYLYDGEVVKYSGVTDAIGGINFEKVLFGNYKLVVTYPYVDDALITRSDDLDVDESIVRAAISLPKNKFNTFVEGVGSAEGLDGVISDEEKNGISDADTSGTVNEIVITQKRVTAVADEIKQEMTSKLRRDDSSGLGTFTDFYDVTIIKTTTTRNAAGAQYIKQENIKVAEKFQTNIFPLTTELRRELASFGGNADNVFVYKRHMYDTGVVVIYNLPKLSEAEGEKSEIECFFIKHVAGEEYIAIRQKEYSVLALGVSPEPILLANEFLSLSVADTTFGDAASAPASEARYGSATVIYTYATEADGVYSEAVPTAAGTYYLKAFVPATNVYAAAEKVVSFTIKKKVVARPTADTTKFTYSGAAQTYRIEANDEYVVTGNVKTNAGKYAVTVALADPANTVWDSGLGDALTFDFVIEKKKLSDVEGIKFEDKKFWFNGKKHCIAVSGELPEGVEVVYQGNGESDLGKFLVTATFVSVNPNYDASEPLTAVMQIRLNWIPIVALTVIVLAILIIVIVVVEKLLKKLKNGGGGGPSDKQEKAEEGSENE